MNKATLLTTLERLLTQANPQYLCLNCGMQGGEEHVCDPEDAATQYARRYLAMGPEGESVRKRAKGYGVRM